jgi:hypothetical protein
MSLNIINKLFLTLLDPKDMITLYGSKKILKSSSFVYSNLTKYLSETNAVNAIFITVNLSSILYQNFYMTRFQYMLTTFSGLRKMYKLCMENPILGIFFYISFYFRLLSDSDRTKFNDIANFLNLPQHKHEEVSILLQNISDSLFGNFSDNNQKIIKTIIENILNMLSSKIESAPLTIEKILINTVKTQDNLIKNIEPVNIAIYDKNKNIKEQMEYDEFIDFIDNNLKTIKKEIRKKYGKRKTLKKKLLKQTLEKKTDNDNTICLDECKPRIKTDKGCYCESECGKTSFLSKTNWCYVDAKKCKKGKYLPKYLGRYYDKCSPDNRKLKCFTGLGYSDCK